MTYIWKTPEGYAETERATVQTPAGTGMVHRRGTTSKFVAKLRGDVLGREYINMDTAKRVVETKVAARLAASAGSTREPQPT